MSHNMKAPKPKLAQKLEDIPNVGSSIANDLRIIGILSPNQLKFQDAFKLYDMLCSKTSQKHDLCVIDVFMSAIYFMNDKGVKPWWHFTAERKHLLGKKSNLATDCI